jgi:hypothetical protein
MSSENGKKNGAGANGASGAGPLDDEELAGGPLEGAEIAPPPPRIAELVASCVRFVAQKYRVPLDFGPDTLSLVDQYVRDARADVRQRPESLPLLQAAVGAYLGEVVRRTYGGYWFCEGDEEGWRVMLSRVYLAFNPIGMAREALTLEEAEGWHAHFELDPGDREAIERRLARAPEVDEEEYFLPTTRHEVVSIVFDELRRRMHESGTADVRFGPDDYR